MKKKKSIASVAMTQEEIIQLFQNNFPNLPKANSGNFSGSIVFNESEQSIKLFINVS